MADEEDREERVDEAPVVAVKEESLIQQSDLRCPPLLPRAVPCVT